MPQMMPLSWLTLMIMFSTIFLLFNSLNFFLYQPLSKTISQQKKMSKLTWKW